MRRRRSINFFRVCGRRQPVLFPGKYLCKKTELHLCYEPMTCKGWWKKTKNFVALVYFYYVFPNIIIECIPINEKRKPSQWSFSQNPLLKRVLTTIFFSRLQRKSRKLLHGRCPNSQKATLLLEKLKRIPYQTCWDILCWIPNWDFLKTHWHSRGTTA